VNHRRVKLVQYLWHLSRHIESYFLRYQNGTKHAIVGFLSKHYHFKLLKLLKEDRETCYQVYPTEAAFQPEPNFYAFASAAASLLNVGVLRLQAHGFVRALEAADQFSASARALNHSRPLVAKYGYKGIATRDLKNNRLKESMITMGNIKSVLYLGTILIVSAGFAFVSEVCSKEIYFMILTVVPMN